MNKEDITPMDKREQMNQFMRTIVHPDKMTSVRMELVYLEKEKDPENPTSYIELVSIQAASA